MMMKKIMHYKLCKTHGKINVFTKGSNRFKFDALYEHTTTKDHFEAYEGSISKRVIQKMMSQLMGHQDTQILSLMKLVYYICKEKEVFRKFESLYQLFFMLKGNPGLAQEYKEGVRYLTYKRFTKILTILSDNVRCTTTNAILKSFFIIIIDKSRCDSQKENLLIFVKYLDIND